MRKINNNKELRPVTLSQVVAGHEATASNIIQFPNPVRLKQLREDLRYYLEDVRVSILHHLSDIEYSIHASVYACDLSDIFDSVSYQVKRLAKHCFDLNILEETINDLQDCIQLFKRDLRG